MAKIGDLLPSGPTLSFEFFPPKSDEAQRSLEKTVAELAEAHPSFVSVTYGAGGSTRERTRDVVVDICRTQPFPAMAHLTCVGHTREDLRALLEDYRDHGVENILALAGDPPADGSPAGGDFTYALELVELVREVGGFSIGVAAHPEVHPRSADRSSDRAHLAAKLAAADFALTQFFFHADDYLRMVDELSALGCDKPVLPGVIPVVNPVSVKRFAVMNGARTPDDLWNRLEATDDPAERLRIAVDHCAGLVTELLAAGVPGIHLYTLNQAAAALGVIEQAGLGR
ncbi:MAG: methylenetetrahydrofolate reductase [Acidimicrobiales bacterium]|jgi:methylenetetrahydrofolate reductase (NADPH)|nr:methylenetetrahydrofolate reductase [Acidimicrobiales bacterium]